MSMPGGLRGRLLAAFVLVSVPPLLVLAVAVNALLRRTFEAASAERLQTALAGARQEIVERRQRAQDVVTATAADLPLLAPAGPGDPGLAEPLGRGRALDLLEVVDDQGRVVSSRHWPAGFGLPDRDLLFPQTQDFRIEKVAEGHGAAERLAVTASARSEWQGRSVLVRGGYALDGAFAADLSSLAGVDLGLYDHAHGRWVAAPGSALLAWNAPPLAGQATGEVVLDATAYRWRAEPLARSLWLVAAVRRREVDAVTRDVRRLTFAIAGVALAGALGAGLVVSRRIARPVTELAEAARRVADGELDAPVPREGPDEVGRLAESFAAMTADLAASRDRLLQAERVAAWREMARRLAHELKNPIFPIQLSIETLRRVLEQDRPGDPEADRRFRALFRESSDTILEELRSLRKIVDEFSQFARTPRPQVAPLDVNEVVGQALALHRPAARAVSVETALASGLPPVLADRDLLSRALGNLIANALEAMPEGGVLRVRSAARGAAVSVEIEDTGPGLTDEQRTRLFTPYFTTKRGGTGLGLAIVQGVVSDHGGRVHVRSETGVGTTFTLVLPASVAGRTS